MDFNQILEEKCFVMLITVDSGISMSPKKPSKSSRKRKNQNKNTSGESQQKVLVSDTQSDNTTFTIPRVTSLMNRTNMDFLHSTPQPQYTGQQGQQGQDSFLLMDRLRHKVNILDMCLRYPRYPHPPLVIYSLWSALSRWKWTPWIPSLQNSIVLMRD